jgi:hypothetical protein
MTTGRTIHPSLIIGHIAVAALALAAMRVVQPFAIAPEWHQLGQPRLLPIESPRRVPMPRRAGRRFVIAVHD